MTACFSLAHLTMLNLSPPELIEVAARAGYNVARVSPQETRRRLAGAQTALTGAGDYGNGGGNIPL